MREHRTLRLVSALTIAATLSVSVLASTAFAALPNISTGGGTVTTCDPPSVTPGVSGADPASVCHGAVVAFRIWAKNCDTSTIQSLTLTAVPSPSAAVYDPPGDPIGVIPSRGICDPGTVLNCSFGTFAPGDEIFVLVAFVTPQTGTHLDIDFQWKTTGQGPDPKGRSHGDTIHWADSVGLNSSGDFAGQFGFDSSLLNIADASVNRNNIQSTALDATNTQATLIGLTVQDGADVTPPSPVVGDCTNEFGQWSALNVGNNRIFPAGHAFKLTITIYQGPAPSQITGVCHVYLETDPSSPNVNKIVAQSITTICDSATNPTNAPCFVATKVGLNTQLIQWFFHNGFVGRY
jgi:hypothetical protein